MPFKLGELLLKEQLITSEQLDEALKLHVVYGIKLGSCLIKLGYVEEVKLTQLLSDKLKVPQVSRKDITSVSKDILQLVSRNIAVKYRVIPFRLERNRLSVAMSDPSDLKAIDDISFATGCVIISYIAPDVLISKGLAKFYNASIAEARYINVAQKKSKKLEQQNPQTVTFEMLSKTGELLNVIVPVEFEGFGSLPDLQQDGTCENKIKDTTDNLTVESNDDFLMDQVSIDFSNINSRNELADVFIQHLGQEFIYSAIFLVYDNDVTGWRGMAHGKQLPSFEQLAIELSKESVFKTVVKSKEYIMGMLVDTPVNRKILYYLKAPIETPLLLLPVLMQGKVAAIVVVSIFEKAFHWKLMELEKLVRKMSLVFEKLIIKHKILMT